MLSLYIVVWPSFFKRLLWIGGEGVETRALAQLTEIMVETVAGDAALLTELPKQGTSVLARVLVTSF